MSAVNNENSKPSSGEPPEAKSAVQPPSVVPPLFRRIDWLTMALAFAAVWIVYFITLAPEVTLEDSGELCTGSFYAGIPHPPGYPVWTIYTWLWTVLVPFANVGWRVALGEATASAFACGLVGLMVSRGSSMFMEGIEELKSLTGKWESAISVVCGFAAGVLLGLGGIMWSESVAINRISLFGVPWMMTVMLCMMRWIYAPHQRRYLFFAMFFFGICLTIHQTLLVAAMGIEIAVASCQPRLGRTFFLGNSVIYVTGVLAHSMKLTDAFDTRMILLIFHAVGIASIIAYLILGWITEETTPEFCLDGSIAAFVIGAAMAALSHNPLFWLIAIFGLAAFVVMARRTWQLGHEWLVALACALLWFAGALFYLYEPISGMTNPPMQWGYPRTVEGFWHAFTRGQYEKVNPTDIFAHPERFLMQLGMLLGNLASEYSWVLIFVAVVPLLFLFKMKKRERTWLICLLGTYFCISVLLIILMNPSDDRASAELHQVFFTSSHAVFAIMIGYGLALVTAFMATHYERFRRWGLAGGAVAVVLAIYCLLDVTGKHFLGPKGEIGLVELPHWIGQAFAKNQYALPVFANLILLAVPVVFVGALLVYRKSAPLAITLGLFAIMPLYSGFSHWFRSEQRNHWFGYWYGHDMFTPPFTGPDGKLSYDPKLREQAMKGPNGNLVYPEMARDAILFGGTDPGRFCPTYMIFCESFIPHDKQPAQDQNFDRRDVYIITQNALADGTYLEYIRAHYNRSKQIDPPFFRDFIRSKKEREENISTNLAARVAYQMLDRPFTALGASIEARRRREGVYPQKEIYIPSEEDLSQCAIAYRANVMQRLQHDTQFPNEPKQVRPDEGVHVEGNQVSFSGSGYVMGINGGLTKVIFDKNPKNEFYLEESFALDWMYPYLSPYGVIMKINREPVKEMTEDMVKRDHEFWSRYSERLIGNWVTYDTTVKEITDYAEKVLIRHDFDGFKGDRKFLRDEDAQKYFSHYRSGIAGSIYNWRFNTAQNPAEKQRMLKEADFAYRQALAFAPFSPEVVFHYAGFLAMTGRVDDALLVANTCKKLDPNNSSVDYLIQQLTAMKNSQAGSILGPDPSQMQSKLQQYEKEAHDHPDNIQAAFNLAGAYMQMGQRDKALEVLDKMLNSPKADAGIVMALAQGYARLQDAPRLETALQKLVQMVPDAPEAWDDLAGIETALGKTSEAIKDLRRCLEENSKRLAHDPKSRDLLPLIRSDPRFGPLHGSKEFQQLTNGK